MGIATRQLHDFPPLPARRAVQGSLAWDLGIARSTGGSVFLCEPRVPLDAAGVHVLRRSPTSLCEALTREEFKCLEMEDSKTNQLYRRRYVHAFSSRHINRHRATVGRLHSWLNVSGSDEATSTTRCFSPGS